MDKKVKSTFHCNNNVEGGKMANISGKDNEYEFVKYLNNKKVSELNPLFRDLIDILFC